MSRRLLLDREPAAVRHARRWVVETFEELGSEDLVGGTAQHPRVDAPGAATAARPS